MRRSLLRLLSPVFSLSLLLLAIGSSTTAAEMNCNNKVCVRWGDGSECFPQRNGPEGVQTHCVPRMLDPTRCVWQACQPE